MLLKDPVTLYGPDGQIKSIPAIDAPGWMASGWNLQPTVEVVLPPTPESSSKRKKLVVAAENDGDSLPEV
jgi:hypothetical protein